MRDITVQVTLENKAKDAAYPGKVLVTYPAFLGYTGVGLGQVSESL